MVSIVRRTAAAVFAAASLVPLVQAHAAACSAPGAAPLTVGTVAGVAPGGVRTYLLELNAGDGIIVDLANLAPPPASDAEGEGHAASKPRSLRLCDATGTLQSPLPGEVFDKGGSLTTTDDGKRLRFMAQSAGRYLLSVDASQTPREILVRRRAGASAQAPVIAAALGARQKGTVSSTAPMVFSFSGTAGQWVELKSTSEKDTLLRFAAPDRAGEYTVAAENDDSDGLNPMIRRKLPISGTYYVQVDSLSEEPGEFELALSRIEAPKPPPPPTALRLGATTAGKLADGDAIMLYALPVAAGHSYRLDLTAPYDGVVAIGMPNPVEPEDGGAAADAGFTEIKSQDSNTTGTERLSFTARTNGQLQVRVKSFGIGESDGGYTLTATDLGS